MLRLFKNLREYSFQSSKVFRYAFYAIGEITLVVIGILIAIKLDNLNEASKNNEDFMMALHQVEVDLKNDIVTVDKIIQHCEDTDSMATLVLERRATAEMYSSEYSRLATIVISIRDIRIHQNGYNLVQKVLEFAPNEYDTLINNLTELYIEKAPQVEEFDKEIRTLSFNTMSLWRDKYEWFSSSSGFTDPAAIKYFLNDWNYRNLVQYRKLLGSEYREGLHWYRETMLNTLWLMRQIEKKNIINFDKELVELLIADTIKTKPCPQKESRDKDLEKDIYSVFIFKNEGNQKLFLYNSDSRILLNVQHDRYHQQDNSLEPGELAFVTDLANNEVYIKSDKGECLGSYKTGKQNGLIIFK